VKKIIMTLAVVFSVFLCVSSTKVSAQYGPPIWRCQASSPYAFGIGIAPTQLGAAEIALHQCAMRSPSGSRYYVDWCMRDR
jgi:hypothetical protein